MASRDYPRLEIEEFGRHLLDSDDLDPIYVALRNCWSCEGYSTRQVHRWLIAYWCWYNAGVASYMSEFEGVEFWDQMAIAAQNVQETPTGERWARGHERRHARGLQGERMVAHLRGRYGGSPEGMVDFLLDGTKDFRSVAQRVKSHYLFGNWIAFKVGDMIDRVLGQEVDFSEGDVFMFTDPVKAALMLWRKRERLPEEARPKNAEMQRKIIRNAVDHLTDIYKDYPAPPLKDRPVGLQEVETVLCKWKSHMNGHYPLNNDIIEIRDGLIPWTKIGVQSATLFLGHMPMPLQTQEKRE